MTEVEELKETVDQIITSIKLQGSLRAIGTGSKDVPLMKVQETRGLWQACCRQHSESRMRAPA